MPSYADQKIVQYLSEAHATEHALIRVLEEQIAVTPKGTYRSGLERHLKETRQHAADVGARLAELDQAGNPLLALAGAAETLVGQVLALSKTPLNLLRGTGGAEKVLKNAKDTCATEALEIATYTAIERLARVVGDTETAELAARILAQEQRMLTFVTGALPGLTDAVVRSEIGGDEDAYDFSTTGAGEALEAAAGSTKKAARKSATKAKTTARKARKVPGVARAEGELKGAVASADDLAISGYDTLNADEITARLPGLSQIELAKVDAYERKREDRVTVLDRVAALKGDEPWPGYDELTVAEVKAALAQGDDALTEKARGYERSHKARAGVL